MQDSITQARQKEDEKLADQRNEEDNFIDKYDDTLVEIKQMIQAIQMNAQDEDISEEFIKQILTDLI